MIDWTMGIHPSARAVVTLLEQNDGIEASWDETNKEYRAKIHLSPWYNGRERGLVMVLTDRNYTWQRRCVAVVYEHRNSDNICVLHWESSAPFLNPPTLNDIPKETYKTKWDVNASFAYNEHYKAAEYIYNLFNEFCLVQMSKAA